MQVKFALQRYSDFHLWNTNLSEYRNRSSAMVISFNRLNRLKQSKFRRPFECIRGFLQGGRSTWQAVAWQVD